MYAETLTAAADADPLSSIHIVQGKARMTPEDEAHGEWITGLLTEYRPHETFSAIDGLQAYTRTVRRCTGASDRNGHLIFEGDFLRGDAYDDPEKKNDPYWTDFLVEWHDFQWTAVNGEDRLYLGDIFTGDMEIIGNKWDNRELL